MPIVVQSRFRPFSYQEMLQPVMMAAQAHQALEDQYSELATKSDVWEKLKDSQLDRDVYQQYKSYSDSLKEQADQLAQFGLTPSSRRAMLDMKARYSKDIAPIEQAWARREQEAQQQREAFIKSGGKNIYSRNARNTRLSDYINDKVQDYSMLNLDSIMSEGVAAGKAISSRYFRTTEGKRFSGDYYNLTTRQGLTPEQAFAVLNDPDKYPEFSRFISDTQSKYQIQKGQSLYSDIDTERATNALMQGINMGIMYDEKNTQLKNWRAEMAAQEAKEKRVAQYKKSLDKQEPKQANKFMERIIEGASGNVNPDVLRMEGLRPTANGYSTKALDTKQRQYDSAQKEFNDFMSSLSESERRKVTQYTPSKVSTTRGAGSYAGIGRAMSDNTPPRNYSRYKQLQDKVTQAKAVLDEENSFLKDMERKYSHLGTGYAAMNTGYRLDDLAEKQEKSSFVMNVDNTEYDKFRGRMSNILGGFSEDSYKGKNVGVFDAKGKKVSYSDARKIFNETDDAKKPTFKISGGKNPDLIIVYDGKEYTMSGIQSLDNAKKGLKQVTGFMSDFTIDAMNTPQGSVTSLQSVTPQNLIPVTEDLYGVVIHDPTNPYGMAKVLIDKNTGEIIGTNTLVQELQGGYNRDEIFMNISSNIIDELSEPKKHK